MTTAYITSDGKLRYLNIKDEMLK